jgi:hypothetical protein
MNDKQHYIVVFTDFTGRMQHTLIEHEKGANEFIKETPSQCVKIPVPPGTKVEDFTDVRKKRELP